MICFQNNFHLIQDQKKNILNDPMITNIGLQKEKHFQDFMDLAAILDAI